MAVAVAVAVAVVGRGVLVAALAIAVIGCSLSCLGTLALSPPKCRGLGGSRGEPAQLRCGNRTAHTQCYLEEVTIMPIAANLFASLRRHQQSPFTPSDGAVFFQTGATMSHDAPPGEVGRRALLENSDLLPITLRQLFRDTSLQHFDLTLTKGRWKERSWGDYASYTRRGLPLPGAELVTRWRRKESRWGGQEMLSVRHEAEYRRVLQILSAATGASLSTMLPEHTIAPKSATTPFCHTEEDDGASFAGLYAEQAEPMPWARGNTSAALVGFLQNEPVCTENLTPILHLLPCGIHAGILANMDPRKLFSADFVSVRVSAGLTTRAGGSRFAMTVQVQAAFSLHSIQGSKPSAPNRGMVITPDILFRKAGLFKNMCASTNDILVVQDCAHHPFASCSSDANETISRQEGSGNDVAGEASVCFEFSPEDILQSSMSSRSTTSQRGPVSPIPPLLAGLSLTLKRPMKAHPQSNPPPARLLSVRKYLRGSGVYQREMVTQVDNHSTNSAEVTVTEVTSWRLQVLLSSQRCTDQHGSAVDCSNHSFVPSQQHGRPTISTVVAALPPNSTLFVAHTAIVSFLRVSDYPSDPFRGLEVLPSVVFVNGSSYRLLSNAILVDQAVPDMSMPYNVLMIVCTALVIIVSSFVSMTYLTPQKRAPKVANNAVPSTPSTS